MSKTKKYARRRRKNKTKKSRMMKGGTITHDSVENKFKPKNDSASNIEQARFYNEVLPEYLGIEPNNANALIKYLENRDMTNLRGDKKTSNGHKVANISTPENLLKIGNLISVRNDELLANEGSDSSQKLQSVIDSLETQNLERTESSAESKSDEGHEHYRDKILVLLGKLRSLTGMGEEAGKSQNLTDQVLSTPQLAAFAIPDVPSSFSSAASSKGCSSYKEVVSLPKSLVGMVIGKKHKNINRIKKETNTIINRKKNGNFVDFTITCTDNTKLSDVRGAAEIIESYGFDPFDINPKVIKRIIKSMKSIEQDHQVKLYFQDNKVRIIGRKIDIVGAIESMRRIEQTVLGQQGEKTVSSVNLGQAAAISKAQSLAAAQKESQQNKVKKNVVTYQVDKRFHDDLVGMIDYIKTTHKVTMTVEPVSASSKITITLEGSKKARNTAKVYVENTLEFTLRGGGKTRKKRKNKSRKKKRRNKKRRTRRRR